MKARIFALLLMMPGACATLDRHVEACYAMGGWPTYTKAGDSVRFDCRGS